MPSHTPKFSLICSDHNMPFDHKDAGVVATQEQCSSSQNSGCGCSKDSKVLAKFIDATFKSPARVND